MDKTKVSAEAMEKALNLLGLAEDMVKAEETTEDSVEKGKGLSQTASGYAEEQTAVKSEDSDEGGSYKGKDGKMYKDKAAYMESMKAKAEKAMLDDLGNDDLMFAKGEEMAVAELGSETKTDEVEKGIDEVTKTTETEETKETPVAEATTEGEDTSEKGEVSEEMTKSDAVATLIKGMSEKMDDLTKSHAEEVKALNDKIDNFGSQSTGRRSITNQNYLTKGNQEEGGERNEKVLSVSLQKGAIGDVLESLAGVNDIDGSFKDSSLVNAALALDMTGQLNDVGAAALRNNGYKIIR